MNILVSPNRDIVKAFALPSINVLPCRASKYVFATAVNGAVGGVNVAVYWHEPTINLKLEIYPLIYPLAKLLDTPINVLPETEVIACASVLVDPVASTPFVNILQTLLASLDQT